MGKKRYPDGMITRDGNKLHFTDVTPIRELGPLIEDERLRVGARVKHLTGHEFTFVFTTEAECKKVAEDYFNDLNYPLFDACFPGSIIHNNPDISEAFNASLNELAKKTTKAKKKKAKK